jgi:Notch-like protein
MRKDLMQSRIIKRQPARSCMLTDPKDTANLFCNFFANIGPELASKIPHHVSFRSFLDLSYSESMFLCPTNKNELQDICYSFKTGKAPGFDNVSMYVIKKSFNLLVQLLANIINLSLCMGIFPEKLKIAKVILIFKSGEQNSFTNYRPISLLSNFSKFFEKVMHNRLTSYIERHEILYSLQFGF